MKEKELKPVVEALIYLAEEPLTIDAMVELLGKEQETSIRKSVSELCRRYASPECGIEIKEIADGYKMATKPEHHDWVRKYLKHQKPPVRLSLAALETLAVIAYKQPVTLPEIQEVRGVNATAVMKTLVERKLVTTGGRKSVVGRPILYKTTKDFLLQFGLKNLSELPNLDEYEEIVQASLGGMSAVAGTETGFVEEGTKLLMEKASGIPTGDGIRSEIPSAGKTHAGSEAEPGWSGSPEKPDSVQTDPDAEPL